MEGGPRAQDLAPTDLRKTGSHFDLPIAVSFALASGVVPRIPVKNLIFMGELALDGQVRSVTGLLPMAVAARELGLTTLYVPEDNAAEAALVEGLEVIGITMRWRINLEIGRDNVHRRRSH